MAPAPLASRRRVVLAAATGAAVTAATCVAVSAPALTRPFAPGLAFLVVLPAVVGALFGAGFAFVPALRRRPGIAAALAALLAASPWLAVAAAPMARHAWISAVGVVLAVGIAWAAATRGSAARALAGGAALVLLALAWPRGGPLALAGERSCVMLGFDGATWEQIDPLIARGEAPAFAALQAQAAYGTLVSEPPTASPVVWTTIATGVAPEAHGIRNFGNTRADLRAGRIWDEVVAQGGSAGVVGWLQNWPPDPTLRFSVPSWLEGGDLALPLAAGFAKRLELEAQGGGLLKPANAPLLLSALAVSSADNAWRMLRDGAWLLGGPHADDVNWRLRLLQARLQTDLFLALLERSRPQFAALVTYPTDSLGHYYWMYHEPQHYPGLDAALVARRGEVVRDAYRTADYNLGKVLARLDLTRTTLILTSDHGMTALPDEERRLRMREKVVQHLLGMPERIDASTVTRSLVLTPREEGAAGDEALALAAAAFEAARVEGQEGGPAPFEVQRHPSQPRTLHVVLAFDGVAAGARFHFGERSASAEELLTRESRSGQHTLNGLFLLAGPGVRAQAGVMTGLRHVAPLALHCMGLAAPDELDASVSENLFTSEEWTRRPSVRRTGEMAPPPQPLDAEMDPEQTAAQLEALGYVQ